jgi:hypothetical protein
MLIDSCSGRVITYSGFIVVISLTSGDFVRSVLIEARCSLFRCCGETHIGGFIQII